MALIYREHLLPISPCGTAQRQRHIITYLHHALPSEHVQSGIANAERVWLTRQKGLVMCSRIW